MKCTYQFLQSLEVLTRAVVILKRLVTDLLLTFLHTHTACFYVGQSPLQPLLSSGAISSTG